MSIVSETLAILDRIPVWKELKQLPERVAALEARIAELERRPPPAPVNAHMKPCRACGARAWHITTIAPTRGHFAGSGANDVTWICDACGVSETKLET